jgi:hypothetical protein
MIYGAEPFWLRITMDDRRFCFGSAGEKLAEIFGLAHGSALHCSRVRAIIGS